MKPALSSACFHINAFARLSRTLPAVGGDVSTRPEVVMLGETVGAKMNFMDTAEDHGLRFPAQIAACPAVSFSVCC